MEKKTKTVAKKAKELSSVFRYYNCNPHHRRTADCVIRALAAGMGETWENVLKDLTEYMLRDGHMLNTPELYGKYLEDRGWVKQKQPVQANGHKVRIADFVKKFHGCAIVHAGSGHITYVAEGSVWDIWDTSNEIVGNYWTYKGE